MMVGRWNINIIKSIAAFFILIIFGVIIFNSSAYTDIIQTILFPFALINDLFIIILPILSILCVLFLILTCFSKNPQKYNLVNLILTLSMAYALFGYDFVSLADSTSLFNIKDFVELYLTLLSFLAFLIANITIFIKNKPKLYIFPQILILGYFLYKVIHFIW